MIRITILLFCTFFILGDGFSQLDNRLFEDRKEIFPDRANKVYLNIGLLGFTRNNEYFNEIADGYTLFGYQLYPSLAYFPAENVRIDAGIYMQKDFGISGYNTIAPTLSVKVKRGDLNIIFGNLDGSLNHRLIEPLYDFERVLNNRLETGLQAVLEKERLFLDAWINWETMIYPGDSLQEEISGGISLDYRLMQKGKFQINLPIQSVLYHKGGQIDALDVPLVSLMNNAVGVGIKYTLNNNSILKALSSKNFFVHYSDFSFEKQQPFENGTGLYLNLDMEFKWFNFLTSYWQGNEFISIKGAPLYQSVSHSFKNPGHTEEQRQLIIFRFLHDLKILDNLYFSTRVEPFIDLQNNTFEFSHGFYVNYRPDFFLFKASK